MQYMVTIEKLEYKLKKINIHSSVTPKELTSVY